MARLSITQVKISWTVSSNFDRHGSGMVFLLDRVRSILGVEQSTR
jgi:hypothetical protein